MDRVTGYCTDDLDYVSTGLCPNCDICARQFGYLAMDKFNHDIENGDIFDEGSFSWSPCDDCNTQLGGTSYIAHGRDECDELIHFNVCQGCLMELNGYAIEGD